MASKVEPYKLLVVYHRGRYWALSPPLLFLIFINYLRANLTCNYMIFADDLKLHIQFSMKSPDQLFQDLQTNIDTLSTTTSSWGLKFAPNKCVHLRFRCGQEVDDHISDITRVSSHQEVDDHINYHFDGSDINQSVLSQRPRCDCQQKVDVSSTYKEYAK
ncbi:hypothetical protein Pmani_015650 [Petrolisthes manimaculis]|uniref:Reverse transcriptase domain-containing protein n=2 Tax=Petrolisthes manimaculis TaxID=1843537 RepID=A0AAE1PT83_9EUCA|nr:hypothetical protein Pmani_026291 [Petrolisthes manimaculis]KAK4312985.1 hypothetical protein Pmani_015650 [Petrolisthes manimaculis]